MVVRRLNLKLFVGILFCSITLFAEVKNVILMIGDGMGLALVDISRIALVGKDKYLEFEDSAVVGLQKTYSQDSLVTDSAAAATALSTGHKTKNSYLGVSVDGTTHLKNLIEVAKQKGKSTGLVTNVTITHATPAGFAVHTNSREELSVADQYAEYKNVDVLLGAGEEYFIPKNIEGSKRKDGRDLISEFVSSGYKVVKTKKELMSIDIKKVDKLLGLFKYLDTTYYIDRKFLNRENLPTLAELSDVALKILSKNEKGFFLMIEAGKIDWACHANDIATALWEVYEFNEAVKVVKKFLSKHPQDTLVIITSDHETGGLGLSSGEYRFFPEKILLQKISCAQIAKILKGQTQKTIVEKFFEYTGIDNLTKEEIEIISKGQAREIGKIISSRIEIGWTTGTHSGCSVLVYAFGKNAQLFSGVYENIDIASKIFSLINN